MTTTLPVDVVGGVSAILDSAQERAQGRGESRVWGLDLLAALIEQDDNSAARLLRQLIGPDLKPLLTEIKNQLGRGSKDRETPGQIPLTQGAQIALEKGAAWEEGQLTSIGLLVGLLESEQGMARGVLRSFGVTLVRVKNTIDQSEPLPE